MRNTTKKTTEETTERFFQIRFPYKDIKFEKECGYFYEWVKRFEGGCVEDYADKESTKAISQLRKEGYTF